MALAGDPAAAVAWNIGHPSGYEKRRERERERGRGRCVYRESGERREREGRLQVGREDKTERR